MKKFLRRLSKQSIFESIPYDDLITQQRFSLFRIFSFTAFVCSLIISAQIHFDFQSTSYLDKEMFALGLIIIINFYAVRDYNHLPIAYLISILSSFLIVHVQS